MKAAEHECLKKEKLMNYIYAAVPISWSFEQVLYECIYEELTSMKDSPKMSSLLLLPPAESLFGNCTSISMTA
jgi:hypothetical protein